MPIRLRVDTELGLAVVGFSGVVTTEEFERQLAPLMDQPEYALMPLTLLDTTEALRPDAPSEIVRRLAGRAAQRIDDVIGSGARMAIIAPGDEFFGLGRMYQALRAASPVEVAVFRTSDEAVRWLELPDGYEDRLVDVPIP